MIKKTKSIAISIMFVTALVLIYVHGQTSVYPISFGIGQKTQKLEALQEDYKHARFRLQQLKSPASLAARAEAAELNLVTPNDLEVVKILKFKPIERNVEASILGRLPMFSWFQFMKEAQAKTSD